MLPAALLVLTFASPPASPLILTRNGLPAAQIVVAPSDNAKAAALELQRYVALISGAQLPIVDAAHGLHAAAGATATTTTIFVGSAPPGDHLAIPSGLTAGLREEGFVIAVRGKHLVVAGNDREPYYGTRYAVVELLHRMGVRWFMPGAIGEVVPHQPTITIPGDLLVRRQPDFALRGYWEHDEGGMVEENREWMIHNFQNPRAQEWVGVPGDGSIRKYIPVGEFEAHPDWFALGTDGKRQRDMVCMTSTGMIAAFVSRVEEDARKGLKVSAFAPDDGMPRCACERCARLATGFDGFGANRRDPLPESSTSNEWFHFVDAVARAVHRDYPDHLIATNGYANRDIPPDLPGFNASKNLVVMFANIGACTIHGYGNARCWQMQRQAEMIRRWCQLSDKVWLYDYSYTMLVGKGTVTPMVHRLRQNIPQLKSFGLMGFFDQDEGDWALTGIPTRLVRAALEWDVHTDVDALLADFYARWYGQAAEPMAAFYGALEKAFEQAEVHGHEDVILNSIYTPALMSELGHDLERAEALATGDPEKAHVGLDRMIYSYLSDYVAMEREKHACHFPEAALLAQKLADSERDMSAVSPFLGHEPYLVYGPPWEARRLARLAARVDGSEGKLVATLPVTVRGHADPADDGIFERWQEAGFDDSGWKAIDTTAGWDGQGYSDARGHGYEGALWYRMKVEVPAGAAGQAVHLFAPAVAEEAWVWVNGQYAGHRPWQSPWTRPQEMDLDVGALIRPGASNQVTIRVLGNMETFGASGIYEPMFLYGPVR